MKHIFIINPAAGKYDKTAEYTAKIEDICKGLDYEIVTSKERGDCTRIAREAAQTGEEVRLYACGGDGTLNEVVQGAAGYENAAVTCYVGGSGNDFVKIFSDREAFRDLEKLLDAEVATFDLIDCNGRTAINIACVGLDSRVGAGMADFKRLPMVGGSMAYILSTVVNVFKGISEHYVVEIDGERIDSEQTFICVANARWYGGGFYAIPDAEPDDGKLDILLVKKIRLWQIPNALAKYKAGCWRELGGLVRHFRTDRIRVICDKPSPVNLDGEIILEQDVTMKVSEKKIRFFYPRGLKYEAEKV